MENLGIKKRLIGNRIDGNWFKYKLTRDKKYLIKLNKYIDQLVVIDNILADKEKFELKRRQSRTRNEH